MKRVMIIGCGGAGKSTLARKLGEKTGLPVIHLDQIFWSPGNWQHLEKEEFDALLMQELEKPAWILDGNFNRTMELRLEKCDTVIYLDYSRWICLLQWIKRVVTHWGRTRPDMGPECNEWFDPEFALWIWNFNKTHRAEYYDMLSAQKDKTICIFRNRRQLNRFQNTI